MPDTSFIESYRRLLADRPDMAVTLGLEPVSGDDQQVRLQMAWRPEIAQPTGVFSAAALFGLADVAGTLLAMRHAPRGFPLAVSSNIHLLGNTRDGMATANARLMQVGRTLIRTDVVVSAGGKDLASVQTTYLNPE